MSVWVMLLGEGLRSADYDEIEKAARTHIDLTGDEDKLLSSLKTFRAKNAESIRRLGIEDLDISSYSNFTEEDERLFALHEWDPEGTGWLWRGQEVRRAPLDVAAAADRLQAAVERRDPDAEFLVEGTRHTLRLSEKWRMGWDPTLNPDPPEKIDELARYIVVLMCQRLAVLCRTMAARGVTNVMVAAEPM